MLERSIRHAWTLIPRSREDVVPGSDVEVDDASAPARSGISGVHVPHTVGTVPPSITYSVPVIEAARGDARNATRSATSLGRAGRPIGMPPSELIRASRGAPQPAPHICARAT